MNVDHVKAEPVVARQALSKDGTHERLHVGQELVLSDGAQFVGVVLEVVNKARVGEAGRLHALFVSLHGPESQETVPQMPPFTIA